MPAYDCTKILIAAIDRAIKANGGNMPSRQQVLDQMYKTDYNGVLGNTSFDAKGDTTNKVITIYTVKDATTGWEVVSTVKVS
jgi:branched-chain amino acid transport system substrate-binding protein